VPNVLVNVAILSTGCRANTAMERKNAAWFYNKHYVSEIVNEG